MGRAASAHQLNDDILLRIFDFLQLDDKARLRRTCRRWRHLLDQQLARVRCFRLGLFQAGGYWLGAGLEADCASSSHRLAGRRSYSASLYDGRALALPADPSTQCFSLNQVAYLQRALRLAGQGGNLTSLCLGQLNVSHRLLMVLARNLPQLEHLELLACASAPANSQLGPARALSGHRISTPAGLHEHQEQQEQQQQQPLTSCILNQHQDEQVNVEARLARNALIRNCQLVREARQGQCWPKLGHLLVKDCHQLAEFDLSLLIALTSHSLNLLLIQSNQRLTGEFLNFCGPKLKLLELRHCPLLQPKFLHQLITLRHLVSPTSPASDNNQNVAPTATPIQQTMQRASNQSNSPQPITASMLNNYGNLNQGIYCSL